MLYANYQHVLRFDHPNAVYGPSAASSAVFACRVLGVEAVVTIPDGDLIEGELPPKKLRILQAWIAIHEEEFMADWALAVKGELVFKIEPLR